jgi:hypothetical protein
VRCVGKLLRVRGVGKLLRVRCVEKLLRVRCVEKLGWKILGLGRMAIRPYVREIRTFRDWVGMETR